MPAMPAPMTIASRSVFCGSATMGSPSSRGLVRVAAARSALGPAGIDRKLDSGHVAGLVRSQVEHGVADVDRLDVRDRQLVQRGKPGLGVLEGGVLQVRP